MGCGSSAKSKYETSEASADVSKDSAGSKNISGTLFPYTHTGSPSGFSPRVSPASGAETAGVAVKALSQSQRSPAEAPHQAEQPPAAVANAAHVEASAPKPMLPKPMLPSIVKRGGSSSIIFLSQESERTLTDDTSCKAETAVFQRALDFLSRVPVLESLDKSDLPLLVQAMSTAAYPAGEIVIAQGKVSNRLFVILSGEADVVLKEGSSSTKLVTLSRGDYFGEQELLHEEIARATVRAAGDEELLTYFIAHDKFWELGLHEKLRLPKRRAMVNVRRAWQQLEDESQPEALRAESVMSDAEHTFVAATLRANAFLPSFCQLTDGLVRELAALARFRRVDAGEVLMRQGDLHGACLYIVQGGCFEIQGRGRRGTIAELSGSWEVHAKSGDSFGELELIYSMPCAATVTARENSTLWAITRSDFTLALDHALAARLDGYAEVLRGVSIFKGLYHEELRATASALTEASYVQGEEIITQGELGDTLFVLVQGEVVVLVDDVEVNRLSAAREERRAELFGEDEIVHPRPRAATVRVVSDEACVLALDKVSFDLLLEPLNEILKAMKESGNLRQSMRKTSKEQLQNCERRWSANMETPLASRVDRAHLELLGNLGSGGFGSVDLAEQQGTGRRFALKCVRRTKVSEPYERRQILAERKILSMTRSHFLVCLYATYRDATALAFLLELLPGGDLRHALCLYDFYGKAEFARFYTAGLVFALEHLHERCILHRDIKPENVLLDSKGWPKLTDFGLAKFCVGKTFTCVGTPLYMAPEILSEVGHGSAVDWWSLAVLMYEMMAACTPFESADGDFFKFCQVSKRGIPKPEMWAWPEGFGHTLPNLISALLQPKPLKRLPMQPRGISQFKEHAWFNELDWEGYGTRSLQPPLTPKALMVENLKTSKAADFWKIAQLPDTDWDVDF